MITLPTISSSDIEIAEFVTTLARRYPADIAIAADLALKIASSGKPFGLRASPSADVASTGGPTSLSTLLAPLYLVAAGMNVPKLGVEGRPAGGLDCLAQIAGYRTALTIDEVIHIISKTHYAHFSPTPDLAPLDERIFRIRQRTNTQNVPTLVAASLLGKKIALGVERAVIDIRIAGFGIFGANWDTARENGLLLISTGKKLGVTVTPVLTDMSLPYQPYVGRAESIVAMHNILNNEGSHWLASHARMCRAMATEAALSSMRSTITKVSNSNLRHVFVENIVAQGGTEDAYLALVSDTQAAHQQTIYAANDGFLDVDMPAVRAQLVHWQTGAANDGKKYADPVGIILKCAPGEWIEKGAAIATVRASTNLKEVVVEKLQQLVGVPSEVCRMERMESLHG
jgi:thymidine phosphorylase